MNWKYTLLLLGILAFTSTAFGQARTRETDQERTWRRRPPGSVIDIDTEFGKERDDIPEESGSGGNSDDEDDSDDDLDKSSGSGSGGYATDDHLEKTTPKATTSKPLTPCENLREASKHLLGNYIPRCTENGDYAAMQCRGYPGTGRCWCSDRNGAEIPGTAMGPKDIPDCNTGTNLYQCAFKIVQHVRNPMYGSYRPRCKVNGDYDSLQCHENQCFCVTKDGEEIPGTTVLRSSGVDEDMCNDKATNAPVINPVHVVTVKSQKPGITVKVDPGYSLSPDEKDIVLTGKGTTDDEDSEEEEEDKTGNETGDGPKKEETKMATTYIMAKPGLLAAIIGGAVVGLLCAILLVMFIVYRMRKKDEGSYALDEPRKKSAYSPINTTEKEYYA